MTLPKDDMNEGLAAQRIPCPYLEARRGRMKKDGLEVFLEPGIEDNL